MFQTTSTHFYIGFVVPVPVGLVADALDRCRIDALSNKSRALLEVALDGANLELNESTILESPRPGVLWPAVRVHGRLRGKGLNMPVEVEFVPWSDHATEVGMRPSRRRPFRLSSVRQYLRAGSKTLLALATQVTEWNHVRAGMADAQAV